MKILVRNEYLPLRSVIVCYGTHIPNPQTYRSNDPEFLKYHSLESGWDRELLLRQQDTFFKILCRHEVELVEIHNSPQLPWQMYTRDVAFVIGEHIYYNTKRAMQERRGEIDALLKQVSPLQANQFTEVAAGKIEGGDVMPAGEIVYVGISSRTNLAAADELAADVDIHPLHLGDEVMHLDTRFTVLSERYALIHKPAFSTVAIEHLASRFELLEVSQEEASRLATNVFLINPETLVVESRETRLHALLAEKGFLVEVVDYSEPIKLGGSFRCTTLPLCRE